jgi:hypothetical protein
MKRNKEIKSKFGIFAVIKIQKYVWNGRWGVSLHYVYSSHAFWF